MQVTSLGYRTDLALRALEGGTETDRGGYLVARNPALPDFWWGNFLLLAGAPAAGSAAHWLATFAAEFPEAQHVAIALDTASSQGVDPAPFVAAGLEYERNLVLTAAPGEVHEPPRPNREATLRPLTGDDDWQQVLDLRLAVIEPGDPPGTAGFIGQKTAADRKLAEDGHGAWLGALAAPWRQRPGAAGPAAWLASRCSVTKAAISRQCAAAWVAAPLSSLPAEGGGAQAAWACAGPHR